MHGNCCLDIGEGRLSKFLRILTAVQNATKNGPKRTQSKLGEAIHCIEMAALRKNQEYSVSTYIQGVGY